MSDSSHLLLPGKEIPFGKTYSARSMRSIQEEVVEVGRSPSTTVPTPDAEYFGSPDDRSFGPSLAGKMAAKGSDSEEEEELAWAKHTSIVTDYGEDVWGPRGRQGRRNSGQKYARGDSPDEEEFMRMDSDLRYDMGDTPLDDMHFAKMSSVMTDDGDVGFSRHLTDDYGGISARDRRWQKLNSIRSEQSEVQAVGQRNRVMSKLDSIRSGNTPTEVSEHQADQEQETPWGRNSSILTDFGEEEGHSVGKMPSLITKTVTKFLQDRGSVQGWEAAAAANAAAQKRPPEAMDSVAVAAGEARRSLPAFLPVSEQEKVQLPLGQAMTGQASTGGSSAGFSPVSGAVSGGFSPTSILNQASPEQLLQAQMLLRDASERLNQAPDLGQLPLDPRLAALARGSPALGGLPGAVPGLGGFSGLGMHGGLPGLSGLPGLGGMPGAFPSALPTGLPASLPGGLPGLGMGLSAGMPGSLAPTMPSGYGPEVDAILAENLLKQRQQLEHLHMQQMQAQQLQMQQLMHQQNSMQMRPQWDPPPQQRGERKERSPHKKQKERQTTVMLRNLPTGYSRDMLVDLMNRNGFESCFDFVYIPINFRTQAMFGYAFVNFVDEQQALRAREVFEGFKDWGVETDKVCEVSWSDMHQGLLAHVNRYRSSPVMHETVPDEYKPAVYSKGKRVSFPAPTKRIRIPRIRRSPEGGEDDGGDLDGEDDVI